MTARVLLLVTVLAASQAPPPAGTGVLDGSIVDDRGQALSQVYVAIYGADLGGTRAVLSGEDGRFRISNLPSGQFMLVASKAAYATVEFGQRSLGIEGTPIFLAAGGRQSVTLRLPRTGTITGAVVDASGRAASGSVALYRISRASPNAPPQLTRMRFYTLRDGAYRADNVAPGEYVLAAGTTFHPSARSVDQARVVSVAPAGDLTGIDIRVLPPAETARVEGTLVPPPGGLSIAGATIRLYAEAGELPDTSPRSASVSGRAAFAIPDVPLGRYTVVARADLVRAGPGGSLPPLVAWATRQIDVTAGGGAIGSVAMEAAMSITGQINVDNRATQRTVDLTSVGISLIPVDASPALANMLPGNIVDRTTPAGAFTVWGVPAGRYVLRVSARSGFAWFARSVQLGGVDVADVPIEVAPGRDITNVVVLVSDRASSLAGHVTVPAAQPEGWSVVVLAADPKYWRPSSARVQVAPVALGDRYTVRGLPAGDYLLALARPGDADPAADSAMLRRLAAGGAKIALGDGEEQVVDLRMAGPGTVATVMSRTPLARPAPPSPAPPAPPPVSTGRVSGTVKTESGQAAVGVAVILFPEDETSWARAEAGRVQVSRVIDGGYAISGAPPGKYKVGVVAEAEVSVAPTPALLSRTTGAALPLELAAGDATIVAFTIADGPGIRLLNAQRASIVAVPANAGPTMVIPGAPAGGPSRGRPTPPGPPAPGSISGVVTDADGRPVAGVGVSVLRRVQTAAGGTSLPMGQPATTDANGFYRITGVAPGTVSVAVLAYSRGVPTGGATPSTLPASLPGPDGRPLAYVTTYFPGVADQASARAVVVRTDEVDRVDFSLVRRPALDVSGAIAVSNSNVRSVGALVFLLPASIAEQMGGSNVPRATMAPDGTFSFPNVPFGDYVISFNGFDGWCRIPVTVNAALAQPLALKLEPFLTVSGRVEFTGQRTEATAQELASLDVRLTATPLLPGSPLLRAQVAPTGAFTVSRVPGGRYTLLATSPAPWIEIAGMVDGRDTLDSPVDLSASATSATVVFADRETSVAGVVRGASSMPATAATVVVFSADPQFWTPGSRRVRVVAPLGNGRYSLSGLPPGSYLAIALRAGPPNPQNVTPDFLRPLVDRAERFELIPGQSRMIDLTLPGGFRAAETSVAGGF